MVKFNQIYTVCLNAGYLYYTVDYKVFSWLGEVSSMIFPWQFKQTKDLEFILFHWNVVMRSKEMLMSVKEGVIRPKNQNKPIWDRKNLTRNGRINNLIYS